MGWAIWLILFLLCFYLPGRAWFSVLFRCDPLGADVAPRLFLEVTLSTMAVTWLGLLLLDFGVFSTWKLVTLLAVLTLVGEWLGWKDVREPYRWRDATLLLVWVVAFLALWPPIPAHLGGGDGSAYLAAAAAAQRTGALTVSDPSVARLDPDLRRILFPSVSADWGSSPYLRLEGGLILQDLDSGLVLLAFHHGLLPWLALGSDWFGLLHMAGIVPLLGSLTPVGLFVLLARLSALPVAAFGALLVLLQPPFAFYARFPQPEAVAAFFVVAGTYLFLLGEQGSKRAPVVAGLVLGTAGLLRMELLFLVPAALLFAHASERRRQTTVALAGLIPALGAAFLQAFFYPTHYWANTATFLSAHAPELATVALLTAALLCWGERPRSIGRRLAPRLLVLSPLASLLHLGVVGSPSLGWLIEASGPLLCLAAVGLLLLNRRSLARSQANTTLTFVAALGGTSLLLYSFAPNAAPVPWWVLRRSVPALMPTFVVLSCLVASAFFARHLLLGLAVYGFLCLSAFTVPARTLRSSSYLASAPHHAETLRYALPRNCVAVLSPELAPLGIGLWLWGAHGCAPYYLLPSDCERLTSLVTNLAHESPTFLLTTSAPTGCRIPGRVLETVASYRLALHAPFDLAHFGGSLLPSQHRYHFYDIGLYRWRTAEKEKAAGP